MSNTKMIWVTFQRKGFHRFPRAEHEESLQDVSYLGQVHRHLFKFKVAIEVFHEDRDIEFHQFLNWIEDQLDDTIHIDYKSCEHLADDLADVIRSKYPNRKLIIEVSEDGEVGITAWYG